MSASFLVDARRAGPADRRRPAAGRRSATAGSSIGAGRCPSRRAWTTPTPRRAVESVPGLRGFVGVDFIWDEATGVRPSWRSTRRPTTSYVGLARALAARDAGRRPGSRAVATGASDGADLRRSGRWSSAQTAVSFEADGTIESDEERRAMSDRRTDSWIGARHRRAPTSRPPTRRGRRGPCRSSSGSGPTSWPGRSAVAGGDLPAERPGGR